MKRRRFRLSRRHRLTFYAASVLLLLSGAAWAWAAQLDETAPALPWLRAIKPWLLKIHGFGAMGFVLLLGTLLPGHVRRAWHARKNRTNGAFFLTAIGLLTLTGYSLYYLGDETWRSRTSQFHLWLGLAAPILFVLAHPDREKGHPGEGWGGTEWWGGTGDSPVPIGDSPIGMTQHQRQRP